MMKRTKVKSRMKRLLAIFLLMLALLDRIEGKAVFAADAAGVCMNDTGNNVQTHGGISGRMEAPGRAQTPDKTIMKMGGLLEPALYWAVCL